MKQILLLLSNTSFYCTCLCQDITLQWVKSLVQSVRITLAQIQADTNKNLYATAYIENTSDIDPGPGIVNVAAIA